MFSRDDILNRLRGHEAELYTRAVDILVSRLRRKLEPLDCIKTLRNAGYALAARAMTAPCRRCRGQRTPPLAASLAPFAAGAAGGGVPAAGAGHERGVHGRHAAARFASGWREAGRPLVADYVDRLAAEIGTPPDAARAEALAARLPIAHPHRRARR